MIKIGKMTDYAIAVMACLSLDGTDALRSAHYLSGKTGIPETTVAKVLKLLTRAGLVKSLRGAAGGYSLAKPAGQISVAEMITALEGPIAIVSCIEGSGEDCKMEATCPTKGNRAPVNNAIRQALEAVKLTDMVSRASCGKVPGAMGDIPVIWMEKR